MKRLRRAIAERLYAWAMALNGAMVPPLCGDCAELRVRIGTGATRPERRRAMRHGWSAGGKGR